METKSASPSFAHRREGKKRTPADPVPEDSILNELKKIAAADCYLCKLDELSDEDWD